MKTFFVRIANKKKTFAVVCAMFFFAMQGSVARAGTPVIISTSIFTGFTQNGTGLFIGSDGFSRLVFLDENNKLTYARCTDANCEAPIKNVIDSDVSWGMRPGSSIMTSGSDGFARIIYTKPDGSLWVYSCLDNNCATTTSHQIADGTNGPGSYGAEITKGLDGFPRIAYFDGYGTSANHFVRCLDADCVSFSDTVFGGEHQWGMAGISLAMGTDGFARIIYPQTTDTVEYARCTNADCTTNVITTIVNDPGNYPGNYGVVLRMGSDGFARVAYLNQDYSLHYGVCSNANCTVLNSVSAATDVYGSINGFGMVIRSGNLASIAYSSNSNGFIHLVNCVNSTCSTSEDIVVDNSYSEGDFSKGISLVLDSSNFARMFYVDYAMVGAQYTYFTSLNPVTIPSIITDFASNVTATSATLNATLADDGGETPTVELKWGTVSGSLNTCTPVTNVGNIYSCNLTGLTADTPYYFQASATNSAGTGTGSEVSFQTTATEVIIPPADPVTDPTPLAITDEECKPMDLSVKLQANGKIKLSWKKTCSLIDKIEIKRKTEQGEFEKIATVKNDEDTYEDDGSKLPSGKYTYRLRGYRKASGKHSDYSNKKSVTIEHPVIPVTTKQEEPTPTPTPTETETAPTSPVVETPQPTPNSNNNPPINAHPTPKPSSLGKVLGEAIATVKQFAQKSATGLTTLAAVGLTAGVAIAASSTAIPLFATSPAPLSEASSRLFGMIGLVGKKKREDDWGIVFDSQTKQPLQGVTISIIDEGGHVVDVSTSDSQGRYGFLPKPGNYTLAIAKKTYELETTKMEDILYGQLYTGQAIKIEGSDMKKINIELKTKAINWQDFAQRKIAAYTSVFSIVKRDFFLILFYAGFVVNLGIAFLYPTTLNIVFFVAYLAMLAYYSFFKKKSYGLVTNTQTSQPVPFAMLSIYDAKDAQRRVAFAVSDVLGRYFMFAKNGSYLLKASGNFLGGNHFEKMVPIEIKDGIVRSDVDV
ncbi:MAG: carboxypeptidase regulatory-like domain-containing protein [Candidatus Moraniibacteriota bacterium]